MEIQYAPLMAQPGHINGVLRRERIERQIKRTGHKPDVTFVKSFRGKEPSRCTEIAVGVAA